MKIVVLIKKTPDTEAQIKVSGASIDTSGTKFIINPYDEYAIEEALKIKEASGDCEVVVASLSDASTKELIIKGLAMGADRGLLIESSESMDSLGVSEVLSEAIKEESPDMVLCGRHAIDDDNMQVGAMVAEFLGWPHVNVVTKLEVNGSNATCERAVEGGQVEVYDVKLPAVFGADKSLNQPRYTSLPGIMKAKKKPFDQKAASDFSTPTPSVVVEGFEYPPEKKAGQMFRDEDPKAMVEKVVKLLHEEAKVI